MSNVTDLAEVLGFKTIYLRYDDPVQRLDPIKDNCSSDVLRTRTATVIGVEGEGQQTSLGYVSGTLFLAGATYGGEELMIYGSAVSEAATDALNAMDCYNRMCADSVWRQTRSLNVNMLYISQVYVAPQYRKKGLGGAILSRYIDWNDRLSLAAVLINPMSMASLSARSMERAGRLALARRFGFEPIPNESVFWRIRDDVLYKGLIDFMGSKAVRLQSLSKDLPS